MSKTEKEKKAVLKQGFGIFFNPVKGYISFTNPDGECIKLQDQDSVKLEIPNCIQTELDIFQFALIIASSHGFDIKKSGSFGDERCVRFEFVQKDH